MFPPTFAEGGLAAKFDYLAPYEYAINNAVGLNRLIKDTTGRAAPANHRVVRIDSVNGTPLSSWLSGNVPPAPTTSASLAIESDTWAFSKDTIEFDC